MVLYRQFQSQHWFGILRHPRLQRCSRAWHGMAAGAKHREQRHSQHRNLYVLAFDSNTYMCRYMIFSHCASSTVCLCLIKEASRQVRADKATFYSQVTHKWRDMFVLFLDEIFGSPTELWWLYFMSEEYETNSGLRQAN